MHILITAMCWSVLLTDLAYFLFFCHLSGFSITNLSIYNPNHLAIEIGHCNGKANKICLECVYLYIINQCY